MSKNVPLYVAPAEAEVTGLPGRLRRRLRWMGERWGRRAAQAGVPPMLLAGRYRRHVPAAEAATASIIHPPAPVPADLPIGLPASGLPREAGWFGFSFSDVPLRAAGPTRLLSIADARVLTGRTAFGDFSPAILDAAGRSLDLREIRHRPFHAPLARRAPDMHRRRAVWIAERVFDNYAHWFTAHLGKLVCLRDLGELGDLVLPMDRPAWVDASLARIGVAPAAELPRGAVLAADELVLLECDRFRPELLTAARSAAADPPGGAEKVFVTRRAARGRRLLGEETFVPFLEAQGFKIAEMEHLTFEAQVALMSRTKLLLAPHGAGLANMLFCAPGTTIIEIADPGYPNPNFYAMAAALGHRYGYVAARGVGAGHPLRRDLEVTRAQIESILDRAA
ncbi:glycosyltransferase family 61 protein [Profundibacterium mesophilum]|uniref:Glycoprotein 2-beta-D-xylosyltransferase n=1 Tax=Profundibacterium mesophilum KAUST100406-0324 TaxID=1037889 RepID=A0A921TD43_9RHOB|nr:glycosyltransferase 61 family protein [Profundibacterium mesophilum]KAF0675901.1 glycoprotein 2-beta-D-xylosyltransferase [Profundibacterium mesophilum KAUST100406-0324]